MKRNQVKETALESWEITRPVPYARNARVIPEPAIAKVAASITEFGFRNPIIVDAEGVIVAGHTRLLAAQRLGLTHVPVLVAGDLTPAQVKAYRLADNRTGQEASWDIELLAIEIEDLAGLDFDLSLTGFETDELAGFQAVAAGDVVEDEAPEPPEDPVSKPGDLWLLGEHRVLCGDATIPADLLLLAGGGLAEVLWTDPPYGVNYIGKTKDALTIANDTGEGLEDFLATAFAAADAVLAPGARFYIAAPAGPRGTDFRLALRTVGWQLHQCLVWVKSSMVLGHSDYHYRHEDVLYGYKPGEGRVGRGKHAGSRWYGDHAQTTVFEVDKPSRNEAHPTMKPVALMAGMLQNSSQLGDVVLDPFLGSGSTLVAAEQTGRTCYGLEIDPRYVDVIVQRWENLTGRKATLDGA